mmetsp:Transcript_84475/g.242554  ORF Transcript_84475/g.242554 Transcript_84475/m.242554 type:complete len:570 (-) Transcript_84475:55-1764(-)
MVEMGVLKEGSTFAKLDLASYLSQDIYHGALVPLLSATVGLAWLARSRPTSGGAEKLPANFRAFEWSYFSVWALCAAADWLQGPYTYALYEAYGFSPAEIAQLFVVGYGSSLVFGCFVGSFTDRYGRKRCCILYCLLYLFSCLTKHFKRYSMLLVGRVTGGIATSMLNSCFECWMVSEHLQRHKFPEHLLSYMFSMMYTVMYCVAIASGLAGQAVTDAFAFRPVGGPDSIVYIGGYCGPFDLSIVCTTLGAMVISSTWEENYGSEGSVKVQAGGSVLANLRAASNLIRSDGQVLALGLVVSCFEGSMYAWVFNWTPALETQTLPPPHGVIFALFMMACMCGASASTLLGRRLSPRSSLLLAFGMGFVAFAISAGAAGGGSEGHLRLILLSFLSFEFAVGVYFPSIGTLKSEIVPEQVRGTVYNLYRMPLNAVVVGLLLSNIAPATCFKLNALLMFLAALCIRSVHPNLKNKNKMSDPELGLIGSRDQVDCHGASAPGLELVGVSGRRSENGTIRSPTAWSEGEIVGRRTSLESPTAASPLAALAATGGGVGGPGAVAGRTRLDLAGSAA